MVKRLLLAVVVLFAAGIVGIAAVSAQDEATPEGGVLPVGVGISPLLTAVLDQVPAAPAAMQISRLTLQPGTEIPAATLEGTSVILVEVGSLTAQCGDANGTCMLIAGPASADPKAAPSPAPSDQALTLEPGSGLVVPAGVPNTIRNAGTEVLSLLFVVLLPATPAGTPTP
jgi:mannose-6-phosphate isomerase-like protein (cupin superfamily)